MNSCGFDLGITHRFTDEDPFTLEEDYWFSEWYPLIDPTHTPQSFIMNFNDLLYGEIDTLISTLPNKQCFAKLDTISSKPTVPYTCADEIKNDFIQSLRTRDYFTPSMKIIIREWVPFDSFEFRCFIHDKRFRAISSEGQLTFAQLQEITKYINELTFYTEYDAYCADMTYYRGTLTLIEINTPVWLFATSGAFSLDEPYDYELLLGEYIPDILSYPVVRIQSN